MSPPLTQKRTNLLVVRDRDFPRFDFEKKIGGQNDVYRTCLIHVQIHHSLFALADGARWSSVNGLQGLYLHEFQRPQRQGSSAYKD